MKKSLKTLAKDLSIEELDALIEYLQKLRMQREILEDIQQNTSRIAKKMKKVHEHFESQKKLYDTLSDKEELITPNPKDGAWIVANSPLVGAWSDMTDDTLEWSKELRRKIESRTDGEKKNSW